MMLIRCNFTGPRVLVGAPWLEGASMWGCFHRVGLLGCPGFSVGCSATGGLGQNLKVKDLTLTTEYVTKTS